MFDRPALRFPTDIRNTGARRIQLPKPGQSRIEFLTRVRRDARLYSGLSAPTRFYRIRHRSGGGCMIRRIHGGESRMAHQRGMIVQPSKPGRLLIDTMEMR